MKYLYDTWYAAAWSSEITHTPMRRILLDEPVALYRTEDGKAVALHDRCPHRFAPLHKGQVFGDDIRCPYHGLRFDPTGACTDNPVGNGHIPGKARVHAYPLRERNGIVWLWFGDAPADESKIVAFDYFDQTDRFASVEGMIDLDANYMLVADNLLDLSHGEFLHPMLAGPGSGKRLEYNFVQDGERVVARHWLPEEPTSPLFKLGLGGDAPDVCNMWSDVTWSAPAVLEVEVGVTRVGGEKTDGAVTIAAHLVTPQTATRSHYFWRLARDFAIDDQALSGTLTEVITHAFSNEDKPMIEAQQEYMGNLDFDQMSPVLLQGDGAGVRARRIMSSLVSQSAR